MTWYLYMVRCKDDSLYTGITTDVRRRIVEHAQGGGKAAKYLRGKRPLHLVLEQEVGSHSEALQIEHRIKRLPRKKKEQIVAQEISVFSLVEKTGAT